MTDETHLIDLIRDPLLPVLLGPERIARLILMGQMLLDISNMDDFRDQATELCKSGGFEAPTNDQLNEWWVRYRGDKLENIAPTHEVMTNLPMDRKSQAMWRRHHSA